MNPQAWFKVAYYRDNKWRQVPWYSDIAKAISRRGCVWGCAADRYAGS